ncbi:hypothetical protein [Flavobacterium sp. Root420]|uniref:hypothetical protein n=1 Tax=Flavobacterium sp. Root420 TaxID=1736533 RepID=UPI0006F852E6|nr:hypothetical protein [Flavobacterium sp. Root420]KQX15812.1 hypothetical protein ASC72_02760 [Flavobacterium sp. Root420]
MKSLTLFLSILIFATSSCQKKNIENNKNEFEGKITYEISVVSKTNNISTEDLQKIYGTRMTKYFKEGNFKMSYNGEDIKTIYFIKNDNKEYDYRNGIDTLFVTPYNNESRQLINSKFEKSEKIILNRKCKLLIHELEDTKNSYWYDPSLYINPENYKDSKFSFTDLYFEQAKAPWLKYKYDGKNIAITYTAIQISEEKLDNNTFHLPDLPKIYYH